MRIILILWAVPLALFWGWYGLSANGLNYGMYFLSRELHDLVFNIYGRVLGIDPEALPGMLAQASIFDSVLIGAIAAYRWRAGWWPQFRAKLSRKSGRKDSPGDETVEQS
jgi:hypothetical protein